jgi:hypothetical protein
MNRAAAETAEFLAQHAQIGYDPLVITLRRPDGTYDVLLRIAGDYRTAEDAKYAAAYYRDELRERAPRRFPHGLR